MFESFMQAYDVEDYDPYAIDNSEDIGPEPAAICKKVCKTICPTTTTTTTSRPKMTPATSTKSQGKKKYFKSRLKIYNYFISELQNF